MSVAEPGTVSLKILDKEYLVSCPPEEQPALQASAEILNRHMRDIRDSGKVLGVDRMAVMAALNLAHELHAQKSKPAGLPKSFASRVRSLQDKVEAAVVKGRQLEL